LKPLVTLVLLLNCIFSAAQNITVQGTVVDEATALPLPGAVVFINQTTKGQKTDSSGFFSITDVNEKQFELVAYAEHYEPLVFSFTKEQLNKRIKFQLHKLNKVVEKAETISADKKLLWQQIFSTGFLGTSTNADECFISNFSSLVFKIDSATNYISVIANEPLQIFNESLGYYVTCYLRECNLNEKQGIIDLEYYTLFKPLTTKRTELLLKWDTRRKDTYDGSLMQFMRSFYNGTVNNIGYQIKKTTRYYEDLSPALYADALKIKGAFVSTEYALTDNKKYAKRNFVELVEKTAPQLSDIRFSDTAAKAIIFSGNARYQIEYISNYNRNYYYNSPIKLNALSVVSDIAFKENLLIFSSGRFFDADKVIVQGYWHILKLADTLPFDYLETK
jgi:hypothetical protein